MKRAIAWLRAVRFKSIRWYFEPRDAWVGLYWKHVDDEDEVYEETKIYFCFVPFFPIRIIFEHRLEWVGEKTKSAISDLVVPNVFLPYLEERTREMKEFYDRKKGEPDKPSQTDKLL